VNCSSNQCKEASEHIYIIRC